MTLDKDFGELAIVKGAPHAGIVPLVLERRAILTVEPERVRVRLPGP